MSEARLLARPDLDAAISRVLEARRSGLAHMPIHRIVETVAEVIDRWLDPGYQLRREAEASLPGHTGYSPEMVREGLPLLLKPFRQEGLLALLRSEFGPALEPIPHQTPEGMRLPRTPRLITHILSGNIPAVGAESIIRALLLRSASLVKTSSSDPLFPKLFVQSLAETDPSLASSIAVLSWRGGERTLEAQAFRASDAVIAYGGDEALEALRGLAPASIRFIDHGHRMSLAAVCREALDRHSARELAARAAWDVCFFDQQGCVSPHAIFVEQGGEVSPLEFSGLLAAEMEALERRWPRGRLTAGEASAIQQVRATWEMRQAAGQPVSLLVSPGSTAWTVLYQEGGQLEPSCLNRVVRVVAVDDLVDVAGAVRHLARYLQTVGLAGSKERLDVLAPLLAEAGTTRVCPIGQMQHPPASWLHDGRHPLRELIRWTEVEGPP